MINKLRAQQDTLHQKMPEEVNFPQKNAFEKERIYGKELEEPKAQRSHSTLSFPLSSRLRERITSLPKTEPDVRRKHCI